MSPKRPPAEPSLEEQGEVFATLFQDLEAGRAKEERSRPVPQPLDQQVWLDAAMLYPEIVPASPSPALPVRSLPLPPDLFDSDPLPRRAALLARAYRSFATWYEERPCFLFGGRTADITRSKFYALLTEAAQAMLDLDINPFWWVQFSAACWEQLTGKTGRAPPLTWTFSVKRMADHVDWYQREAARYDHRYPLRSPIRDEWHDRYHRMRYGIMAARPRNAAEVRAVVDLCLPPKYLETSRREVVREEAQMAARLEDAVARGAWIWGRDWKRWVR